MMYPTSLTCKCQCPFSQGLVAIKDRQQEATLHQIMQATDFIWALLLHISSGTTALK
jgi:hypothetical protein